MFFREGKKLNKKILQKILKDNSTVLHIFANKDSCYTEVLQTFSWQNHTISFLDSKVYKNIIKHITKENIHTIPWKVYCFELSSYCTPLPPPPPLKLAPDIEGQMANFPKEFLEHHPMLTDVLQKELWKHFRAEFCPLPWNSLLLTTNLDSFFCVTEMASFVFQKS